MLLQLFLIKKVFILSMIRNLLMVVFMFVSCRNRVLKNIVMCCNMGEMLFYIGMVKISSDIGLVVILRKFWFQIDQFYNMIRIGVSSRWIIWIFEVWVRSKVRLVLVSSISVIGELEIVSWLSVLWCWKRRNRMLVKIR